jgi:hypothetical protein
VVAGWTKQQKKRKEKKLIFIPPETETPILEVNFKNYISHVLLVFSFRFLDLSLSVLLLATQKKRWDFQVNVFKRKFLFFFQCGTEKERERSNCD